MPDENNTLRETEADIEIRSCLNSEQSFSVIAGAGSGKTTSLIMALKHLRRDKGSEFRRDDRKIACITYTNRAVDVISDRLDWDDLFFVSTIHTFLWREVKRFTQNIREALREHIIPKHIEKKQRDDNGGQSKKAISAREKISLLQVDLNNVNSVVKFDYNDTNFSNYSEGQLNHDDIIEIAAYLIMENENLRKIMRYKYPYILVDEAQDTFNIVVEALNKLCENIGLPVVGYFGDPMQQIYEKRAGNFAGPENSVLITKEENFRCSCEVINLLNAFRTDVQQVPAGMNANIKGSVHILLVAAEEPDGERSRYSEEQIDRVSERFEKALLEWSWNNRDDVKQLFLVHQMIARRGGFPTLHKLFSGKYASSKAHDDFLIGEHYLIKPFVSSICHLVQAHRENDLRMVVDILRKTSPAFYPQGVNAKRTLAEMKQLAQENIDGLSKLWDAGSLRDILKYCREINLYNISDRLSEDLDRTPRVEEYNKDLHSMDKSDWLSDAFLSMTAREIGPFVEYFNENTPFSTQHGVKGEEYRDVLVVFDDTEAAWRNYSFTKTLTPNTSGNPTEGQFERSRKLAYVCFSRAEENLRILLFTPDPEAAKSELIESKLFEERQIDIAKE